MGWPKRKFFNVQVGTLGCLNKNLNAKTMCLALSGKRMSVGTCCVQPCAVMLVQNVSSSMASGHMYMAGLATCQHVTRRTPGYLMGCERLPRLCTTQDGVIDACFSAR